MATAKNIKPAFFVGLGIAIFFLLAGKGLAWTLRPSGVMHCLRAVIHANNTIVAVGDRGTILTSRDGLNWTSQVATGKENHDLYGMARSSP